MIVQPNSLAAHDSVQPDLSRRQHAVLQAICELHEARRRPSDQDVAATLNLPINSITPRRGELEELGLILMAGHKTGRTGRRVAYWAPTPTQLSFWNTMGKHR